MMTVCENPQGRLRCLGEFLWCGYSETVPFFFVVGCGLVGARFVIVGGFLGFALGGAAQGSLGQGL